MQQQQQQQSKMFTRGALAIGKSARKVPYGPMNLQKFAHFHVLSAHYIALSRAI
jgi:hypothetical protein